MSKPSDTEISDKEYIVLLREALESLLDDDKCRYDHHGYCQTHYLGDPCEVAEARRILALKD